MSLKAIKKVFPKDRSFLITDPAELLEFEKEDLHEFLSSHVDYVPHINIERFAEETGYQFKATKRALIEFCRNRGLPTEKLYAQFGKYATEENEAKEIVFDLLRAGITNKAELSRQAQVTRPTVYRYVKQYEEEQAEFLKRNSLNEPTDYDPNKEDEEGFNKLERYHIEIGSMFVGKQLRFERRLNAGLNPDEWPQGFEPEG